MAVLVTGADTLLGSQVAKGLLDSGFTVRILVTRGTTPRVSGVPVETCSSLALDLESCLSALADATAVFHFDSERMFARPGDEKEARAHIEGTRNLLVAMTRAGVEDMVYSSSALSFEPGTMDEPGDESLRMSRAGPACLASMRATEDLLQRYGDDGRLRYMTVHPTVMMGEGAEPGDTCWWLMQQAAAGLLSGRSGGINIARASDAAAAVVKALGRGKPCESFILGGENISLHDLGESIALALAPLGDRVSQAAEPAGRRRSRRARSRDDRPEEPLAAQLAGLGLYYTPALAAERFDLQTAATAEVVRESVEWYSGEGASPVD